MNKLDVTELAMKTALEKTKGLFNKNAVQETSEKFSEYANEARGQITELETKVSDQGAQILKLNESAEKAKDEINKLNSTITYQKGQINSAQKQAEKAMQAAKEAQSKLKAAHNKKFNIETTDNKDGSIKTTTMKPTTGLKAEVTKTAGQDEMDVVVTTNDGTIKHFLYNPTKQNDVKGIKIQSLEKPEPKIVDIVKEQDKDGICVTKYFSDGSCKKYYPAGDKKAGYIGAMEQWVELAPDKTLLKKVTKRLDGTEEKIWESLGASNHYRLTTKTPEYNEVVEYMVDANDSRYKKIWEYTDHIKKTLRTATRDVNEYGFLKPEYKINVKFKDSNTSCSVNVKEINTHTTKYIDAQFTTENGETIVFSKFDNFKIPTEFKSQNGTIETNPDKVCEKWNQLGGLNVIS